MHRRLRTWQLLLGNDAIAIVGLEGRVLVDRVEKFDRVVPVGVGEGRPIVLRWRVLASCRAQSSSSS